MRGFFIAGLLLLFSIMVAVPAFALSDAEYKKLTRESPAFAQAEARLNAAWKRLRGVLSKAEYDAALKEQRQWNRDRDVAAQAASRDSGMTAADALAAETVKRAEELEARAGAAKARPSAGIAGAYVAENGSVEVKKTEEGYFVEINTAAGDGRWVCEFSGTGAFDGKILTAASAGDGPQTLRMRIEGRRLSIDKELNAALYNTDYCGWGGSVEGTYTKKR